MLNPRKMGGLAAISIDFSIHSGARDRQVPKQVL